MVTTYGILDVLFLVPLLHNGSFTQNNLLPTVRQDCKKLGAAPISSNGLKPVRWDSRQPVYFKIIWCEWSINVNIGWIRYCPKSSQFNVWSGCFGGNKLELWSSVIPYFESDHARVCAWYLIDCGEWSPARHTSPTGCVTMLSVPNRIPLLLHKALNVYFYHQSLFRSISGKDLI